MKLQFAALAVWATAALVVGAGPAAAQGTFNPNGHRPSTLPSPGFGPPAGEGTSAGTPGNVYHYRPATGQIEQPKPFKPYEPPRMGSVYSSPKPAAQGAKPCELSVYVNACDRHH
ncbi:MAG TPA: hypothetical protein VFH92_12300 [Phenylobacterium sp.]|nr:hypothetical protein [Phenylobacterium sp.]